MEKINLNEKFNLFNEHWTPKTIGELNGQQVKLAKVKGELSGMIMPMKMSCLW